MLRCIYIVTLLSSSLIAFETTNVQLLYSENFNGDTFVYDTQDAKKTTITFEHFRTFDYGDFYMFVDIMNGENFSGSKSSVYTELAPRLSVSKLSGSEISFWCIKDVYIAAQVNTGYDYNAYLGGVGLDLDLPGFNYFALNVYYKRENIEDKDTFQITPAYATKELYNIHLEGFMDITSRSVNTQNQLLYSINKNVAIGSEWIYYKYDAHGHSSQTSLFQAMLKYIF